MKAAIYSLQGKYLKYQMLFAAFSLFLQRSPVVRMVMAVERSIKAPFARLAQIATIAFTASSIPQSVTGATTFSTNPTTPTTTKTGESFNLVFAVTGAPSTVSSWRIKGTLPQGLNIPGLSGETLNTKIGTITGTPSETGTFQITAQAYSKVNMRGDTNKKAYPISITVEQGIVIPTTTFTASPSSSASGEVGQNFSQSFSISGISAASWKIVGTLPPGLTLSGPDGETPSGNTLNAPSGTLSGTPTAAGAYNLAVQAYDQANLAGTTDNKQYPLSITIAEPTFQNPFEEWSFNHFSSKTISPSEDPDRDGLNNLLEYAFGTDPIINDTAPGFAQSVSILNQKAYFLTKLNRHPDRSDIDIIVESTSSLQQAWTPIANSSQGGAFTGSGSIEETPSTNGQLQVSISAQAVPQDDPIRFQRIRVVRNSIPASN